MPPTGATPPGSAPSPAGLSLSPGADAWLTVIGLLGNVYPTSRYAAMGERDAMSTALAWHRAMVDVPAHGVIALYDRLLAKWTSSFPPTLGDFRGCWLDWETFYTDTNGEADDVEPAAILPALLAGPVTAETPPGLKGARLQNARVRDGLTMVCCHCLNTYGLPTPAVVSRDGDLWQCAEAACDFSLALADTDSYRPVRLLPPAKAGDVPLDITSSDAPRLMFTDLQIVARLRECGMVVDDEAKSDRAVALADAIGFGRRMERILAPHLWSLPVLRAMWVAKECR
jgi:hypothetical protein